MLSYDDLRAILEAIKACDKSFEFTLSTGAVPKPEQRKKIWKYRNQLRVSRWRRR